MKLLSKAKITSLCEVTKGKGMTSNSPRNNVGHFDFVKSVFIGAVPCFFVFCCILHVKTLTYVCSSCL